MVAEALEKRRRDTEPTTSLLLKEHRPKHMVGLNTAK